MTTARPGATTPSARHSRGPTPSEVEADTRKLDSFAAFKNSVADTIEPEARPQGRGTHLSLRAFAEQRSKYLLDHPEIKKLATVAETREGTRE